MRVFGIKITLHPLFGFIILASVFTGYFIELLILFGIVLIHELGHTTMASYFGWKVKGIELLPFGGVAVVEQQEWFQHVKNCSSLWQGHCKMAG